MTHGIDIAQSAPAADDRPRGRPAAGQDPVKRSQIIQGARRVFMDMGFDAASMNDITREAGVSKGTIYVYFSSKEELFVALIEEERQTIFNDLYAALESDGSLRETLVRYGTALVAKVTSDTVINAQRTVIGICERMPELGVQFYERGPKRGHDKLVSFLKRFHASGHLAIPDLDVAAFQFTELCLAGLFRQRLFGYRPAPPAVSEIAKVVNAGVDVFLRAYAGNGAGPHGATGST